MKKTLLSTLDYMKNKYSDFELHYNIATANIDNKYSFELKFHQNGSLLPVCSDVDVTVKAKDGTASFVETLSFDSIFKDDSSVTNETSSSFKIISKKFKNFFGDTMLQLFMYPDENKLEWSGKMNDRRIKQLNDALFSSIHTLHQNCLKLEFSS